MFSAGHPQCLAARRCGRSVKMSDVKATARERAWVIASGILLVVAAVFVWRNNLSAAFVSAALGACAWFLSYRAKLRTRLESEAGSEEEFVEDEPDED